ncbi:MAG: glycoside hydrolase family 95 protein [Clostridia bacterium]|nr:glycoside hydrolase family 95 protein [Clostridia bacterium]
MDDYNKVASDSIMYVNNWSNKNVGYALMKFDLPSDIDISTVASADLAVYATEIVQNRSGNITVSEIKTDGWSMASTYGDPNYADIKISDIKTINSDTQSIFPMNNYSSIDIADHLRNYAGASIGIGIGTNYASVLTLAGKNSDHPPKLIIQPGKKAELTYTVGDSPCVNMAVTVEAVGATEYRTKSFTTDRNGKITLYLTEGSYKVSTEQVTGVRNASENIFTVSDSNITMNYTLEQNTEATPASLENPTYTFGNTHNRIKEFNTSSLSETAIGDTGMKVTTNSSNYNNAVVMSNATKSNADGYYPYGTGLADNGYYLFLGSGGNSSVNAAISFDNAIKAGKYIKITFAKPSATNNGSTNRTANNAHKIVIGTETLDIVGMGCENDKWYTATVKAGEDISKFDITLGKWAALAISKIEVTDSADTMEFTAEDSVTEKYITSENQTVRYIAKIYNSITTLMGGSEVIATGSIDATADIIYSVNGYDGVSIDETGSLIVTPRAKAGIVTVSAEYGGVKKSLSLELKTVSDADGVKIVGDELIEKNGTLSLKAIPTVGGMVIPERSADWKIEGTDLGCTITDGILTAGNTAGNVTITATLKKEGAQTTENVSDSFVVTVKGDDVSPYTIKGIFLKNCAADVSSAAGIDGMAIDTNTVSEGYKAVVKATDANGIVLAETTAALDSAAAGVTEIKTPLTFAKAAEIKAYIINGSNEVVSDEIYKTAETLYKNLPLVSDWITGARSGLGMGAGIMAPTGVPYGVDPAVADVSSLNVSYSYDANYPEPTADNALWYKTGAYLADNSSGNNSIYARDGVDWEQKALPIGNGYMGAMLFGLPDKDQIQLNEETFWAAGYRGVQSSVAANNVNKNMSEGINGFMSVGNLFVDMHMPKNAQIKNYYRDLNLNDAVAHVRYEYGGTKYNREYFASYPKEVVAIHYTADKENALTFDVDPVSMHPGEVTVKDGEITIIGKLKDSEPYSAGGKAAWNQESDLEYCTKIKVIAEGGTVTDGYNTVSVKDANSVTILVAAATDYDKDQFIVKSDGTVDMSTPAYKSKQGVQAAIDKATARMNGASSMTYDALKAEHTVDYKSQFDKVKFTLTDDDEICNTPTDELQSSYSKVVGTTAADGKTVVSYDKAKYAALNKHLEELHYNYARYMMISSSRSTTMPATLQGKWCQSTAEIWGSCYCININMEMNYWFAGGANLLDSNKSLIRWFNSQIPAGAVTAKNMYKVTPKSYTYADGKITFTDSVDDEDGVFIMHTKQAITGTTDLTGSTSIQSAGNTAWLMYNLWDMYQTSGDKELLENDIYPIMRKAANFYTQYIYINERKTTADTEKYPDGYYYTTWAGRSPEQGPTHEGIKYDLQLVAGMYDYTIAAAETLGVDEDKVAAWKEIRNHLQAPVELGADGEIKEWEEEVSYNTDANGAALGDPVHRHISHLVGLYPGTLINRDTPEYLDGAKIVLQNRGDDSTGWSCSNKFLLWARTLEGDKALELFRYQLAKKTYSNLFDTHAPFQIDGNFGSAAGVMELLMQSQTGDIYILPALPAVWDKGEISGIKAKNGAEISIKWENNKATDIKVIPAVDGDVTIGYDKGGIEALNGRSIYFTDGKYTIKDAKAGMAYTFTASGTERSITSITPDHVTASAESGDTLIVAGYDTDGKLIKVIASKEFDCDISGYDECAIIKAMLWDDLENMIPYAYKEYKIQ